MNTPVRLLILSDLHLEFASFITPDPALFDIVVLAGDIGVGVKAVHWARRRSTFAGKPVVLVPGNHEFYNSERTRMLKQLREAATGTNVHLLDRDEVILHGVRFLGATLWTDFELDVANGTSVPEATRAAVRGLNDFGGTIRERRSEPGPTRFTPEDARREHALSRAWLRERLQAPVDASFAATVVVTHHAPSARSMDPVYEGSDLNPCYYSDLPESFFQTAALWIHGHSHSSSDYLHHRTRVIANPRGYVRWNGAIENANFDSRLVITVGADHA
jgi:DNA repair exonuclease SbcCD nuclease subunit